MRVLIVGGTGLLGSNLRNSLTRNGHEVVVTSRQPDAEDKSMLLVNLENIAESLQAIRSAGKFDVVVLSAGVSSIRACKNNPKTSSQINVDAQVSIAQDQISRDSSKVVLISTNRIFDGSSKLVSPNAPHNPTTIYGDQKSQAERQLVALGDSIKIVRFSKVISKHSELVVDWYHKLLRGETVSAFVDVAISPITVDSAVCVIERVVLEESKAVTQFSATDEISFFEMASLIASYAKAPATNVLKQLAKDVGDNAVAHSSLESTVFSSIKPMSSLQSVHHVMEKITSL